MKYSEWNRWVRQLPWTMKWFVVLVILRPLVDILYFLKEISPLLSPLYIVGVMTPIIIVMCLLSPQMPRVRHTLLDYLIIAWGIVLAINCLLTLTLELSLDSLRLVIRQMTPLFLILYLRRFIRSRRDLTGLLTTFLYSTVFPFAMLLYERFVGPIGPTVQTRGHERFEGLYADVVSYAIYVMGALLIVGYFFLQSKSDKEFRRKAVLLMAVGFVSLMGLVAMHHTASWMVAAMLVGLLCFYSLRKGQVGTLGFMVVLLIVGYIGFGSQINERLGAALQTDIAVLEGEKDIDRAFHGRVWRWKMVANYWFEKPLLDKLFGLSVSSMYIEYSMLGSGIHNDYMRIICMTGILGFILYALYYAVLFLKSTRLPIGEQFLLQGSIMLVLMYSITTTPSLYPPLLYLVFSIYAYGTLPGKVLTPRFNSVTDHIRPQRSTKPDQYIHV